MGKNRVRATSSDVRIETRIATVGAAFRHCALRPCSRSALPTRSHTPLSRHARNLLICCCDVLLSF